MKSRNKGAFTLIELLVVIAIIAILAAILFPVFAQAKLAAKKANDLSQLDQLGLATLMYTNDYDDQAMAVPYAANWSTSCPGCSASTATPTNYEGTAGGAGNQALGFNGPWWTDRLMPYVKNKGIFANPVNTLTVYDSAGYWLPGSTSVANNVANTTALRATGTYPGAYRVTYTYNEFIAHEDNNPLTPGTASMTGIPEVADTVLMGPSPDWYNRSSCRYNSSGQADYEWDVSQGGGGYELWGANNIGDNLTNAGFNSGANFSYADGHAKYAKLSAGPDANATVGSDNVGYAIMYVGYFPTAKTHPDIGTTCPADFHDSTLVQYQF